MSKPHKSSTQSDALVLFGVTGDLAHKMIFPALYAMVKRGVLTIPIIGVAFSKWSLEQLRTRVKDSLQQSGGINDTRALNQLLSLFSYVSGDYNAPDTFTALKELWLMPSARRTISLSHPRSLLRSSRGWVQLVWPSMHASSSKSPSDAIWPPRGNSTA